VQLLESFVNVDATDWRTVIWQIAMLLTFVLSGVALAWMDRLSAGRTRDRRVGPDAASELPRAVE
jgi:uncharacterized membrane protein YqhA